MCTSRDQCAAPGPAGAILSPPWDAPPAWLSLIRNMGISYESPGTPTGYKRNEAICLVPRPSWSAPQAARADQRPLNSSQRAPVHAAPVLAVCSLRCVDTAPTESCGHNSSCILHNDSTMVESRSTTPACCREALRRTLVVMPRQPWHLPRARCRPSLAGDGERPASYSVDALVGACRVVPVRPGRVTRRVCIRCTGVRRPHWFTQHERELRVAVGRRGNRKPDSGFLRHCECQPHTHAGAPPQSTAGWTAGAVVAIPGQVPL
jgi:hypothetical protein